MKTAIAIAIMMMAAPAIAGTTYALSPQAVEAAKEAGAARAGRTSVLPPTPEALVTDVAPRRRVAGEMGVAVGTGGYTAMYGAALMPLGDSGSLALSFVNEQDGSRIRRGRR